MSAESESESKPEGTEGLCVDPAGACGEEIEKKAKKSHPNRRVERKRTNEGVAMLMPQSQQSFPKMDQFQWRPSSEGYKAMDMVGRASKREHVPHRSNAYMRIYIYGG